MNKNDLMLLASVAGGVYLLYKFLNGGLDFTGAIAPSTSGATLTREYNGWKYYSDGTVIGPDGTYYQGGVKIWSPADSTNLANGFSGAAFDTSGGMFSNPGVSI